MVDTMRHFGGKRFYYWRDFAWFVEAERRADSLRKRGFLARVVKIQGGWKVVTHPKLTPDGWKK